MQTEEQKTGEAWERGVNLNQIDLNQLYAIDSWLAYECQYVKK